MLAKFRYLVVKGCLTFFGTVKLLFIYHGNRVRCVVSVQVYQQGPFIKGRKWKGNRSFSCGQVNYSPMP